MKHISHCLWPHLRPHQHCPDQQATIRFAAVLLLLLLLVVLPFCCRMLPVGRACCGSVTALSSHLGSG